MVWIGASATLALALTLALAVAVAVRMRRGRHHGVWRAWCRRGTSRTSVFYGTSHVLITCDIGMIVLDESCR